MKRIKKNNKLHNKALKYFFVTFGLIETGGPESMHQAAFAMRRKGFQTYMAYFGDTPEPPKKYLKYNVPFIQFDQLEDSEQHVVIFPEWWGFMPYIMTFCKAKLITWWLSLDNRITWRRDKAGAREIISFVFRYIMKTLLRYPGYKTKRERSLSRAMFWLRSGKFLPREKHMLHVCSSMYAYDYVKTRCQHDPYLIVSPISDFYFQSYSNDFFTNRENVVLFNPTKSGQFIEFIKPYLPSIVFIPLSNMSETELITEYRRAKIYADFGPFPGPERMPKEAVINGCAIITGMRGASSYYFDVPIPQKYKLDIGIPPEKFADIFRSLCTDIFANYSKAYLDFEEYRKKTRELFNDMVTGWTALFNMLSGKAEL